MSSEHGAIEYDPRVRFPEIFDQLTSAEQKSVLRCFRVHVDNGQRIHVFGPVLPPDVLAVDGMMAGVWKRQEARSLASLSISAIAGAIAGADILSDIATLLLWLACALGLLISVASFSVAARRLRFVRREARKQGVDGPFWLVKQGGRFRGQA